MNQTQCCKENICTGNRRICFHYTAASLNFHNASDCFLQISIREGATSCPFCKTARLGVVFSPDRRSVDDPGGLAQSSPTIHSKPPASGSPQIVLASPDSRRELEAEMQNHRRSAGDIQDISTIDMRSRSASAAEARRAQLDRLRRANSQGNSRAVADSPRQTPRQVMSRMFELNRSDSDEEEIEIRRRPPPSRPVSGPSAAVSQDRSRHGDEWMNLHELLTSTRGGDAASVDEDDISRIEQFMIMQV